MRYHRLVHCFVHMLNYVTTVEWYDLDEWCQRKYIVMKLAHTTENIVGFMVTVFVGNSVRVARIVLVNDF